MKKMFILFFTIFLLIFGLGNYYVGTRIWQFIISFAPSANSKIYWIVFWFIALSYVLGRIAARYQLINAHNVLSGIGSYWLAALLYLFLSAVLIDFMRLLGKWTGILPQRLISNPLSTTIIGAVTLVGIAVTLIYGTYNARKIRVSDYDISIPKNAGQISGLNAVLVSDLHLGDIIGRSKLQTLVDKINAINPDIVFICGDIVDEDVNPVMEQKMGEVLKQFKSKYGVYAILGGHEYYGGYAEDIIKELQQANIQVLVDEAILVDNAFYVIGRKDKNAVRITGTPRMQTEQLTYTIDKAKPIILLNHEPNELDQAEKSGADLQLSGHSHNGQLFPINFITSRVFKKGYGYYRQGNLQEVVTSGFGTWGPPIRVGTKSEIVRLRINFTQ